MVEKLSSEKSEVLDIIPMVILGIRRPYNFKEDECPIFFNFDLNSPEN
jgi:hypothetical protein